LSDNYQQIETNCFSDDVTIDAVAVEVVIDDELVDAFMPISNGYCSLIRSNLTSSIMVNDNNWPSIKSVEK
jgi:hypothetical protein